MILLKQKQYVAMVTIALKQRVLSRGYGFNCLEIKIGYIVLAAILSTKSQRQYSVMVGLGRKEHVAQGC